eukprot:11260992-Ditylum_brightwellii.AAC.1
MCLIATAGQLQSIGAQDHSVHNKNISNSRVSITTLRTGCTAGLSGPTIFLPKGKNMTCCSFRNNHLSTVYGLPAGSCVIMTPSGYMDDTAWKEVVAILAPAIWKMP